MRTAKTRVTLLTGFLGAGKTTLLNALLRQTTEPLDVIVNDFGDINVDAALVSGQVAVDGEVALQGGCICCTIRDDLLMALLRLRRRPAAARHVIIETSGLSDPAAVARTFVHPRIAPHVELSAIVGCVDPTAFATLDPEDRALASGQLRVCDFVVLTKSELCDEHQRAHATAAVEALAPGARILLSSREDVPTALLLDGPTLWSDARVLGARESFERPHVHAVGHGHGHHHPRGHAFETWSYESDVPLSAQALRSVLADLPRAIFRAKGIVHVAEDPAARVVAHVVGARVELHTAGTFDGPARTQLVFLAREGRLDPGVLRTRLDACAGAPAPSPLEAALGVFDRLLAAAH